MGFSAQGHFDMSTRGVGNQLMTDLQPLSNIPDFDSEYIWMTMRAFFQNEKCVSVDVPNEPRKTVQITKVDKYRTKFGEETTNT